MNAIGVRFWLPSCPIKTISGRECMGCGTNRALIELFQGNFTEALHHNWGIIIWIPLSAVGVLFHFKKFKPNK